MKRTIPLLLAVSSAVLLSGCNSFYQSANWTADAARSSWHAVQHAEENTIGAAREGFFSEPRKDTIATKVSSRTIYLRASEAGKGLTSHSIQEANRFLNVQGPLRRQVLTIIPLTPNGAAVAPRLAQALSDAGARSPRVLAYQAPKETQYADSSTGFDLQLVSEAVVVTAGPCRVANAKRWTIEPFYATGTLGCANEANIALMTSDPRDLMRPAPLDDADGSVTTLAVQKYQQGETEDLIDIDFSQEDN